LFAVTAAYLYRTEFFRVWNIGISKFFPTPFLSRKV